MPYDTAQGSSKNCIIFMDGEFPPVVSSKIPIFFMLSEERNAYHHANGAIDYLMQHHYHFKHYKGSKHISFMDHGMAYKDVPQKYSLYFNGTSSEMLSFYKETQKDIKEFLKMSDIF